ncbi:MAG: preprotein translocase subunit SecA, partial [Phycisphaerae bacterium]|nr:preprotein translocase subunit SecA [Phycisphaerae bacterium]
MVLEFIVNLWGKAARKIFGSRNERLVAEYRRIALRAGEFEAQVKQLSDDELRARKDYFRQRLPLEEIEQLSSAYDERMGKAAGETERARLKEELKDKINKHLEALLPEVFAVVREVADRTIGERPYDVQLMGGQVLHEGNIAEMATGEGKTLVATLPVYLNALLGRPVHVVSTNDYLIKRDQEWMGPIYKNLGLTVGYIQAGMNSREKQPQYACDVTYGTNNEFGFDYLRDNMKTSKDEQVQRELNYAIVDEVDSVLVDEARTPLIISGPAFESTVKYQKADDIARKLKPGVHFEVKEKEHQCPLSEEGIRRAEELAGARFYVGAERWDYLIGQALRAHYLYRCDKEYVLKDGEVIIVDGFTGRLMPGRQWSDGLHQAVEAKHVKDGIRIKEETQTLATITFQNFFRMYRKLAGMTGTAMTEAEEFDKIYKLETVAIPTNRPLSRTSHADVIYRTAKEKYKAIVDEIHTYSKRGRPVLVGTISIENSELLSTMLSRTYGVEHEVLNAKFHEKEAEIVAKAGQRHTGRDGSQKGNVTIATNMAGRGTDIKLGEDVVFKNCYGPWNIDKQDRPDDFGHKCCVGCPEYPAGCKRCFKPKKDPAFPQRGRTECRADPPCGLHVIGTERHESRRIDNQLRGRSGRQGDPGSSRFFLSLEDDLMRIFASRWVSSALAKLGMEEGMALEHRWLTRGIEKAQKKVEERNFGARKNLLEYDEVMDQQRKIFYGRRQNILEKDNLKPVVEEMLAESVDVVIEKLLDETYPYQCAAEWAARELNVEADPAKLQGRKREELEDYLKEQAKQWGHDTIEQTIGEFIPEVAGA